MTREQNDSTRALVRDLYESYARGDTQRVAELIDDDIEWIMHGPVQVFSFLGPRHGKADVMQALADIGKAYALERYEPEVIVVEGDRAAVMSNVAFIQLTTRRTLSFRVFDLLRFRGNRLVEFHEFSNTFDVVEQAIGRWLLV
jgi:ketosteroid isomerase-like protein